MSAIEVLSRARGWDVLRQVADHPEGILQSEVADRSTAGAGARNARIRELVSEGLISREDSHVVGPRYRLRLTPLGRLYVDRTGTDPSHADLIRTATALQDALVAEAVRHNPNLDTHLLLCQAAGQVREAIKLVNLAFKE